MRNIQKILLVRGDMRRENHTRRANTPPQKPPQKMTGDLGCMRERERESERQRERDEGAIYAFLGRPRLCSGKN